MDDHGGFVNPIEAAQRAVDKLVIGDRTEYAEAIRELAHGLASLARQHNTLAKKVRKES